MRRTALLLGLLLLVAALVAACNNDADSGETSTTAAPTTTSTTIPEAQPVCPDSPATAPGDAVEVRRSSVEDCATLVQRWVVEARADQWLTFANDSDGSDWNVQIGEYSATIPPGEALDSPPLGGFVMAGVDYQLGVTTVLNLRDVSFGPLQGEEVLLQRVGPIGPGQTLGEVTANARHPVDLDESFGAFLPNCATGTFRNADGLYMLFEGTGDELRLQYIEITEPGLATRSGIEVGSSIDDVFAAYGTRVETRNDFGAVDGEVLAFVPESDTSFGLIFLTQDDVVSGIRQGFADAVGYGEGCA